MLYPLKNEKPSLDLATADPVPDYLSLAGRSRSLEADHLSCFQIRIVVFGPKTAFAVVRHKGAYLSVERIVERE